MSAQEERRSRGEARAQQRLEEGLHDVQENKMPEQDPEVREVLRSKYRELKQSIAEDEEDLGRLDSNRFHELVDKTDDLSKEGNGVEGRGGGAGAGEKKVTKFSFAMAKPSTRRPPLPPPKGKEKEKEDVVEYVTSVDAMAGVVVLNPRAGGGKKVVPKLENTWRPEKRMKNIVMESDVTKSTEETFETLTMDAGPKPNVQYGLTLMERVGSGCEAEAPRRMSLKELEEHKLRQDLANLPEEATLDQYEELPVEEFGEALLRGMGWEKGKPIGRNSKTIVEPVEYTRRQGTLGLGATPPSSKPKDKKYVKPGETREQKRDNSRREHHQDSRRYDSRRDEHQGSQRYDSSSSRDERRESRRDDEHRESRRDDSRRDEHRDSRREHKRSSRR